MMGPVLALRGITKTFPGVLANDRVNLDIYPAEVHALLGENGAGKSTLMKVLYGFYRADAGEIRHQSVPVKIHSPHDARQLRIGMVFQTFTLVPALSVVENIALFLPDLPAVPDLSQIVRRLEEISVRYGIEVDPWAPVRQLSIGEQQKVEILKLLLADAKILILDEPTRVLAPHEIDGLFQVFATLRRDGYAIVFITHKLHEVLVCADRITVMRRGTIAGTLLRPQATEDGLLGLMFGAAPPRAGRQRSSMQPGDGPPALEFRNVGTASAVTGVRLSEISLSILPGEILGLAGVSGNGQRELGDLILGVEHCADGAKLLFGEDATDWSVSRVLRSGVAFIPEDPLMVVVPALSIQENMALTNTRAYTRYGGLAMDWRAVQAHMHRALEPVLTSVPQPGAPAGTLSGGNLQRLVLGRELARDPRLIVAFYPTRGLDAAAAAAARERLVDARNGGAGVLLISEDLDELFALSDRLIVLYRGRIVGSFSARETTIDEVGRLMSGGKTLHAAAG